MQIRKPCLITEKKKKKKKKKQKKQSPRLSQNLIRYREALTIINRNIEKQCREALQAGLDNTIPTRIVY